MSSLERIIMIDQSIAVIFKIEQIKTLFYTMEKLYFIQNTVCRPFFWYLVDML